MRGFLASWFGAKTWRTFRNLWRKLERLLPPGVGLATPTHMIGRGPDGVQDVFGRLTAHADHAVTGNSLKGLAEDRWNCLAYA